MDLILKKSLKTLLTIEIVTKFLFFLNFFQKKNQTMDFSSKNPLTTTKFLMPLN